MEASKVPTELGNSLTLDYMGICLIAILGKMFCYVLLTGQFGNMTTVQEVIQFLDLNSTSIAVLGGIDEVLLI